MANGAMVRAQLQQGQQTGITLEFGWNEVRRWRTTLDGWPSLIVRVVSRGGPGEDAGSLQGKRSRVRKHSGFA